MHLGSLVGWDGVLMHKSVIHPPLVGMGGIRVCVVWRSMSVLTPARSWPWAMVPFHAFALAVIQQLTQNWCGPRDMIN
jgi:hypothetical protein